jgi:DUF1365 family protein
MPLCMLYIDLAELDEVMSMSVLLSGEHVAPLRVAREDYLGPTGVSLDVAVRERVRLETGLRLAGPIRMLTHPRHMGFVFNPVTFYYCFDADDARVEAIVAEITNTPWMERHAYVLDVRQSARRGGGRGWRFQKVFHVSPLLPMDLDYEWILTEPIARRNAQLGRRPGGGGDPVAGAARLGVQMNLTRAAEPVFDASLSLQRRELTPAGLRRMLVRYPMMTAQVVARIHWEAVRLWLKGARAYPHPGGRGPAEGSDRGAGKRVGHRGARRGGELADGASGS